MKLEGVSRDLRVRLRVKLRSSGGHRRFVSERDVVWAALPGKRSAVQPR